MTLRRLAAMSGSADALAAGVSIAGSIFDVFRHKVTAAVAAVVQLLNLHRDQVSDTAALVVQTFFFLFR